MSSLSKTSLIRATPWNSFLGFYGQKAPHLFGFVLCFPSPHEELFMLILITAVLKFHTSSLSAMDLTAADYTAIFPSWAYFTSERWMDKKYRLMGPDGKFFLSDTPGRYAGWNGRREDRKIFGRLDCRAGMRMHRENRVFFLTWDDAIAAGFRPCKICKPVP